MDKEKIKNIISEYNDSIFLTGGVSADEVREIENKLNVLLPDSYKWFLEQYGEGIIVGVEVYGAGAKDTSIPSCVKFTQKSRQDDNLPNEYVVIEELGELTYCIDTSTFHNNECHIVSLDPISEVIGEEKFENFYHYLNYRVDEMVD